MWVRRFLLLMGLLLVAAWTASPAEARPAHRSPLILISIDGFRPDYLDRGITPNLSALAKAGVRGAMHPSFPSLTFPNHYTLVTGLRPDHHGIVDNVIEDTAVADKPFMMSDKGMVADRRWWDGGEPIWVTAQRQGLTSATLFWPGSEAPIHGALPTEWKPFDHGLSSAGRVAMFLNWLGGPKARWPRFMTLYFDAVDTAGHKGGPGGREVNGAIADVDAAIGQLIAGLKARGGADANIIIVADHGMADVGPERRVYLDDIVPQAFFRAVTVGPTAGLIAEPGHEAEVEAALLGPHDHFQCWKKADMPARFHYGTHPRIPPIVCLGQTDWILATHERAAKREPATGGAHGFDPYAQEMQAVFIAVGPAFGRGRTLAVFDNVDVYPLMARVLGIRALPNDGNLAEVLPALR
jgi:predicted AlkP superfamily pyrophosphatase or phosphodiesterase